jgi:hypothetical protein
MKEKTELENAYKQLAKEIEAELAELKKQQEYKEKELNGQQQTDYMAQIQKLQKANQNAVQDIEKYNEKELVKAAKAGNGAAAGTLGALKGVQQGSGTKQDTETDLTEKLLSTLSKPQAKNYLTKNEKELRSKWGAKYDQIVKSYS